MKRIILALAILSLVGCSTEAVSPDKAKSIPPERIFLKGNGDSTFIVTRDSGRLIGGSCFVTLTIDGAHVARMDTGETISFKAQPRRHVLGIAGDPRGSGLCAYGTGKAYKETGTVISANETQKFRIAGEFNTGLDIRPTTN